VSEEDIEFKKKQAADKKAARDAAKGLVAGKPLGAGMKKSKGKK